MNSVLLVPILLPILAGIVCFILPKRAKRIREILAIMCSATIVGFVAYILLLRRLVLSIPWLQFGNQLAIGIDLRTTPFGTLILLGASCFSLLVTLYSLGYMRDHVQHRLYYGCLLLTLGATAGAGLADNLILFLFCWELVGILLYVLVSLNGDDAMASANKTLVLIGTGDLCLLLGIGLLWLSSGTLSMQALQAAPQTLHDALPIAAFLLIMLGSFAKAGMFPLHSWIPAIASHAPIPVLALLPAALDKLLGIYLLTTIALQIFTITYPLSMVLMILGALTIVVAVLMALIQHDYRKMLGFHAISQVGYMVLGIGTGSLVGILGGLFRMLNNTIYKSCLFLCTGAVKQETGRTQFSKLGGLASAMPWSFATCLIAALAISGIPPLNGFVSKWMIYQGILETSGGLFPLFLLAAMFGSALTLASFMKLMYAIFWGDRPEGLEDTREVAWGMRIPMIALALLCMIFGVFFRFPVTTLIKPILGPAADQIVIPGIWDSSLATVLIIVSLIIGFLFYLGGRARDAQDTEVFLGGEVLDPEVYRVPGTHLYGPIKSLGVLQGFFRRSERGDFDLYNLGIRAITWLANVITKFIDQALSDLYREILPNLFKILGQLLQVLNTKQVLTALLWVLYIAASLGARLLPEQQALLDAARILAIAGIFGWGLMALVESDLKRFVVFTATSQFGFVLLGLTTAWTTGLLHFASAGVAVLALSVCCASICRGLHTTEIKAMDGLASRMPGHFIVFILAFLWLSGLPPFGNFFSKYLIGLESEKVGTIFPLLLTSAAILTIGYFLRPIRSFLHASE